MKIEARSTFAKIRFDQEKDAHLVLTLTAPTLDNATPRPSICIIPCVDISGSMRGSKLEFAKRSLIKLIDHLRPTDYCGVVAFESSVYTVASPERLENGAKDKIKNAVSKLHTMGGTNFSGGLLRALELIKDMDLPESTLLRVIMFTDGQANEGCATKTPELVKLLNANRGRITVSAFGYGDDADQTLLTEFSTSGKGNYAYIKEPDAALSAFGTELGGLLSTYATDLMVEVEPLNGHMISEVVSDVDADEEVTGEVTLKIPDILAEEARHLVLAAKFSAQKQAFPREVNVFNVKCSYAIINSEGQKERKTEETKVKIQFVKNGEEQTKPDSSLDTIVGMAQLVRAQVKADEAARSGNFAKAEAVMNDISDDFESRGLGGHVRLARGVQKRMASQNAYNAGQGYLRSMAMGGSRGMGVANYDKEAVADIQGLGFATSNSVQANYAASFSGTVPSIDNSQSVVSSWGVQPQDAEVEVPPVVVDQSVKKDSEPPEAAKRAPIKQTRSGRHW